MTEGHSPPAGTPTLRPRLALPKADAALIAGRAGLLVLAGAIEGLMLANSPVLEKYAAVRLGPDGVLIDVTLLCAVVLAAVGALAAFAAWAQVVFLGFIIATASWSLAESSQHPFWIFSNKGVWRPHAPSAGDIAAHILAIACVCLAALAEALQAYRAAARAQSFTPKSLSRDTSRLSLAGFGLLGVTAAITLPLVAVLDGVAKDLIGAVAGKTAFTLLIGSAVVLLIGLGLLAAQGRSERKAGGDTGSAGTGAKP